jgi:hypothetical protein
VLAREAGSLEYPADDAGGTAAQSHRASASYNVAPRLLPQVDLAPHAEPVDRDLLERAVVLESG